MDATNGLTCPTRPAVPRHQLLEQIGSSSVGIPYRCRLLHPHQIRHQLDTWTKIKHTSDCSTRDRQFLSAS
jgi:hypothetical protein